MHSCTRASEKWVVTQLSLSRFPLSDAVCLCSKKGIGAVMDLNGLDLVALSDRIDDILTFSHFAKHRVLAIEVRSRPVGDEKLGTVGIRPGICHGENTCFVVFEVWLALTLELVARATHTCSGGVTTLNHEIGDHTVEYDAIVEAIRGEAEETSAAHLCISRKHADFKGSLAGIDGNVDVFNVAHVVGKKTWFTPFCTDIFRLPKNT